MSNILDNNFINIFIISICMAFLINRLIGIEFKFLKKYAGDILKILILTSSLAIITRNVMNIDTRSEIINTIELIYSNFLFIVITLLLICLIDKYLIDKRLNNDIKYFIILSNIYMYLAIILGKSKLQIILVGIIFMICKLLDYKCIIENKYEDLKESFSIKGYTFNSILLFIVIYCGVNCLVNKLWDVGILIIGALCLIIYLLHKKLKLKVKDKYEIDNLSDKEIGRRDQLFETRKKELDYILKYFRDNKNKIKEPFAVSISGKWGEGKTSFTNVLKEELKNDYIILDIHPMITDTKEGLIKYFSRNLENQFIQQGIDTGTDSSIEDYFTSIFSLIDSKGIIYNNKILKNNKTEKLDLREKKQYLQQDIDKLILKSKKNILVVVDDFDRFDNETRYSILTFIKEIINFNGIKTIILLDYSIVEKEDSKITYEFLEKFINKRFELSRIDKNEILEYYDKMVYDNEIQEYDCNFDLKLNNVIKDLNDNIKYIIDNLDNKVDKYNKRIEELKYSKQDEDIKEIENKKEKIIETEYFKIELINSIGNTRKLKRIIREIQDKIHYMNYIYNKFSSEQKDVMVENLDISKIITTMTLIKVLFEKEYDVILRSKDFETYLKNIKNSRVKGLIYSSIFRDVDEVYHTYSINEKDMKIIEFIDNVYICINTPKDFFEFRTEEERLIDIISNKPINFNNEKSVYDNIKYVYDNVQYSNIKERFDNISEYITCELSSGNIELYKAVQLIKTSSSFPGIVSQNKMYIKTLAERLKEDTIIYPDKSNKDIDEYMIKRCKEEIINSNKPYIAIILTYKTISAHGNKYDVFIEELKEKESIEQINEYVNTLIDEIDIDSSLSESEKFLSWAQINKKYNDNINCDEINQRMHDMIDILDDLELIEEAIYGSHIESYKIRDSYIGVKQEELIEDLKTIKNIMENKNLTQDQCYDLIESFQKSIYRLSDLGNSKDITEEDIKMLDDIYSYMYNTPNFNSLNKEIQWNILSLDILNIKRNQGQLVEVNK